MLSIIRNYKCYISVGSVESELTRSVELTRSLGSVGFVGSVGSVELLE